MKRTDAYNEEMTDRGKRLILGPSLKDVFTKVYIHICKIIADERWQHGKPQYTELNLDKCCKCEACMESKLLIISRSAGRMHIKLQNEIQIEKAAVKSSSIMLQFGCGNLLTGSFYISVQSQKAGLDQRSFMKHHQVCIFTDIIGGIICHGHASQPPHLTLCKPHLFFFNKKSQSPCRLRRTWENGHKSDSSINAGADI